ncbi:MAG TPA: hypothetical protein VGQ36_03730 [Thermoanaerobaculia bacterium]|jgi:hypothetical protein|nr:hypothetical protein [Thermoanaerobaculia bacterium]
MEPDILRRGKEFHRRVQTDWAGEVEKSTVRLEKTILLALLSDTVKRGRRGRMDIFIDKVEDFVTVVEIKATDWDRVLERNRRKLLGAHRRQVMRYVDQYVDHDHVNVCAGIIYPQSPRGVGLKEMVEQYLNDHALQVVWFDDP